MRDRKLKMLGIGVVAAIVVSVVVMLLWNALLPTIFGVPSIGFLQALGLLILCRLLFGGFGGRGMFWRHGREMRERWMAMTPEQRDAFFQQGFGHRHGGRGHCHPFAHRGRRGCHDRDERQTPQNSADEKPVATDKPE